MNSAPIELLSEHACFGGAQQLAAELGLTLIAPGTSSRGTEIEKIKVAKNNWNFGLGGGFYLDATHEPDASTGAGKDTLS